MFGWQRTNLDTLECHPQAEGYQPMYLDSNGVKRNVLQNRKDRWWGRFRHWWGINVATYWSTMYLVVCKLNAMRQLNLREERLQRAKASIQKAEKEKRDRGGFGTTVGKGKSGKDKFGKVNSSTGKTNSSSSQDTDGVSRKTKRDLERRLKSIHGSFRHYVLPDDRIRPGLDEEGNEVFRPYADWIDRIDGEEDPNQAGRGGGKYRPAGEYEGSLGQKEYVQRMPKSDGGGGEYSRARKCEGALGQKERGGEAGGRFEH